MIYKAEVLFIAAVVLVSAACAFTGIAMPVGSFPGDTFFLLSNAYRVAEGQIPHLDFSSPWGPVIFLIEAAGLRLAAMRPDGLAYANAVFGPLVALWTFFSVRARWSPVLACIAGGYALLLVTAPFSLGNNPLDFSYAMVYNRYAYALLGIVLMECAADMLSPNVRQRAGVAVSTGAALGLLALLKISFALAALPIVAALPIAGSAGAVRRLAPLLAGFAVVVLAGLAYLRFDLPDMWRDLTMTAHSRSLALNPTTLLGVFGASNAALVVLAALVARHRGAFLALVTIAVGSVVLLTNQQLGGFPLDGYAAIALVAARVPNAGKVLAWPTGIALLAAICVLPVYVESSISLVSAALARQSPMRPGVTILKLPERQTYLTFAAFRGQKSGEPDVVRYTTELDEGLNLLRAHADKREGVLSFEEFDAFNYLVDLPPPRGGFAAAAYDYIFDDAAHPTPERFFGNAAYVMVPIGEDSNTEALLRLYGSALQSQFQTVAQTKHWVLWRRKMTP